MSRSTHWSSGIVIVQLLQILIVVLVVALRRLAVGGDVALLGGVPGQSATIVADTVREVDEILTASRR